jgi:hypothetical protein
MPEFGFGSESSFSADHVRPPSPERVVKRWFCRVRPIACS